MNAQAITASTDRRNLELIDDYDITRLLLLSDNHHVAPHLSPYPATDRPEDGWCDVLQLERRAVGSQRFVFLPPHYEPAASGPIQKCSRVGLGAESAQAARRIVAK